MTFHNSTYTVRTGEEEMTAHSLDEAIAIASDHIDSSSGPVEIVDASGNIVFDQPQLVERIIEYREAIELKVSSLRRTPL